MTRKTHEEMKADPARFFIQLKEIEKAGSFDAWEKADIARIKKNRPAAQKWAKETAARIKLNS